VLRIEKGNRAKKLQQCWKFRCPFMRES